MPNPAFLRLQAAIVAFFLPGLATGSAQVFYHGSLGLPAGQGWTYVAVGSATQTLTSDGVVLDTSPSASTQAGYSRTLPGLLDRTNGFALAFTAQMISESHASANRAGFSVILLADDTHGIELAFWTNNIFAQSDSPLFVHAEETNYSTTAVVDYALTLHATNYVLSANGTPILTGPVRDYTAFNGFPNPYRTPDFLFFGDDTTSAAGAFLLKKVALITPPQLVVLPDNRIAWTGVSNQTYTVQASSNLINWAVAASVTSESSNFVFTNTSSASSPFFRVSYP